MVSNRRAGTQFKNLVLLYLHEQGVDHAVDPFAVKRLMSEMLDDPSTLSDIGGVNPWMIDVRTGQLPKLSDALNEAKQNARVLGTPWYVSIQNRRGHGVADAYCVLPLSIMTRIFAGDYPRPYAST